MFGKVINMDLSSLQAHYVYCTFKQRGNDCFYGISTENTQGVFVGIIAIILSLEIVSKFCF